MSKLHEIHTRIYRIRGQPVMIDSDLAALYGVATFNLNKAVKRKIKRFPVDFMFRLSSLEWGRLIFQIGISKAGRGGRRYRPFAFTQEGIAMLSSVLNSERAIDVNIAIMRAFVRLRHALLSSRDLTRRIEKLEGKMDMHETDIRLLVADVDQLKKRAGPSGPIHPAIV